MLVTMLKKVKHKCIVYDLGTQHELTEVLANDWINSGRAEMWGAETTPTTKIEDLDEEGETTPTPVIEGSEVTPAPRNRRTSRGG